MKKAVLIVMIALMATVSVLALTACAAKPEGVYKFESVNVVTSITSITYSAGDGENGDGNFNENSATLTLNKDGTYVFVDRTFLNVEKTGTWEVVRYDDGSRQIRFDEDNDLLADFTKKGLTFYYSTYFVAYTYKLTKQK